LHSFTYAFQISGDIDVARNALIQVTTRLKANFFEREGALSALPPPVPYAPILSDDVPKYTSRDSKSHSRGYSSYSGGYGSADVLPSDPYGSYGASQARFYYHKLSNVVAVCVHHSVVINFSLYSLVPNKCFLFYLCLVSYLPQLNWDSHFLQGGGSSYGSYGGYSGRSGSSG